MAINLMIWPSTGGGRGITFPGLKNSISCVYLDADRTRSPVSLKTGGRSNPVSDALHCGTENSRTSEHKLVIEGSQKQGQLKVITL